MPGLTQQSIRSREAFFRWMPGLDNSSHRSRIQCLICPSGKSTAARKNLSSPRAKNISLFPKPKSVVMFAPSRLDQRDVRVVTDVGCGMRWTLWRRVDERRLKRTAKSCGPGVPTLVLSCAKQVSRGDGGKRARSPGRARISRKTIAQGRPDDPPVPVVLPRAFLLHADHGCGGHPVFPAPSVLRGRSIQPRLGCNAPRDCGLVSRLFENSIVRLHPNDLTDLRRGMRFRYEDFDTLACSLDLALSSRPNARRDHSRVAQKNAPGRKS